MTSYFQLLTIILPAFTVFGLGMWLRRLQWIGEAAETGLLKLLVNILYPCLILKSVLGNQALREPANLMIAPLLGFGTLAVGMGVAYYAGRMFGLTIGHGLRTFAFAVGIYNYGYIPIPLMQTLWGSEHVGVLLVYNVGVEFAIWTIGLLLLSGLSSRDGWRKIVNPVACTLLVAVAFNLLRLEVPRVLGNVFELLAGCAVPFGLLLSGAAVEPYLRKPLDLLHRRVTPAACMLRLGVLPVAFLAFAKWSPLTIELKRVLVIQAAMPAGMLPLVIARHYGGQPLTAAQIIVGTTLLGLVVIPLWIVFGLYWVGV
ncbi:MAG: AEC family transporter [Opitutae bacterium]|nr:AEC family transporter [Opitutae bacterium]